MFDLLVGVKLILFINISVMKSANEIIQVNITGDDKPGVSSLTQILVRRHYLDIGQTNIHHLSLGILFQTTPRRLVYMKDLLFKSETG